MRDVERVELLIAQVQESQDVDVVLVASNNTVIHSLYYEDCPK